MLLEDAGEIKFADKKVVCQVIQRKLPGKILIDEAGYAAYQLPCGLYGAPC